MALDTLNDYIDYIRDSLPSGSDLTAAQVRAVLETMVGASFKVSTIIPFGTVSIRKLETNTDNAIIEIGDAVVSSNLAGNIHLIYGDYTGGVVTALGSYNPDTVEYVDNN